jgi:hypothetical protein
MTARVLIGSKQEIAQKVAAIDGDIREAIVFIDEPSAHTDHAEDIFAEMEPFTVREVGADDSRPTIYERQEGE